MLLAALLLPAPAMAQDGITPQVLAVIQRTRNPGIDYSVVRTERLTADGRTVEATIGQYRRGRMERFESGSSRDLINCETGERYYLGPGNRVVRTSDMFPEDACGFPNVEPVSSSRMLPAMNGPWGRADVIELTGQDWVRRYVVTTDGIVVSYHYRPRRPGVSEVNVVQTVVTRATPDAAMFDPASLDHGVTRPLPATAPRAP